MQRSIFTVKQDIELKEKKIEEARKTEYANLKKMQEEIRKLEPGYMKDGGDLHESQAELEKRGYSDASKLIKDGITPTGENLNKILNLIKETRDGMFAKIKKDASIYDVTEVELKNKGYPEAAGIIEGSKPLTLDNLKLILEEIEKTNEMFAKIKKDASIQNVTEDALKEKGYPEAAGIIEGSEPLTRNNLSRILKEIEKTNEKEKEKDEQKKKIPYFIGETIKVQKDENWEIATVKEVNPPMISVNGANPVDIQPHDIVERIEMPYQEGDKIMRYSLGTWWNYTVTKMDPMKIKSNVFKIENEVNSDFSLRRPIEDYVPDTQIFVTEKFYVKSGPIERGKYLTVKENYENWITATIDGINADPITIKKKDLDKIIKTNHGR